MYRKYFTTLNIQSLITAAQWITKVTGSKLGIMRSDFTREASWIKC